MDIINRNLKVKELCRRKDKHFVTHHWYLVNALNNEFLILKANDKTRCLNDEYYWSCLAIKYYKIDNKFKIGYMLLPTYLFYSLIVM